MRYLLLLLLVATTLTVNLKKSLNAKQELPPPFFFFQSLSVCVCVHVMCRALRFGLLCIPCMLTFSRAPRGGWKEEEGGGVSLT